MKKWILILFLVISLLAGCSKKMDMNNVKNEPNFSGIVEEISENSILVKVNETEDEFQSSDLISVSLDAELKDSVTNFNIGDEVRIYYDGNIAESYPAQINKVYAITLISPSHLVEDNKEKAKENVSKFSKEEIAEAIKAVEDNFNFPASTLTKVWYDEEKAETMRKSYLENGRGSVNGVKAENVIVLLSNFEVDDSGDNPVLNPDSTYENYQWILIRDSKESDWKIDDWGY